MKTTIRSLAAMLALALLTSLSPTQAEQLRLHAIFDSDMVLQRGKPITIWGWAEPGAAVAVQLGTDKADAKAAADKGRWEVTLPAREASAAPQTLTVTAGGEKVEMNNIVVGDVWVMYGQSNMAFPLGNLKVNGHQEMPIPEFRTDSLDLPESEDLTDKGLTREFSRQWNDDGKARLEYRRTEEAKRALQIIERLKTLGKPKP